MRSDSREKLTTDAQRARDWLIAQFGAVGLKKYATNTSWPLLTRCVTITLSFFVTIYLVRYLGPENYGQLSYAVSLSGIFAALASLGVDHILTRELVEKPERRNELLGTALIIKLCMGALVGIALTVTALVVAENDVSRLLLLLLAPTYIFMSLQTITMEFQANVAFKHIAIIGMIVVVVLNALKIMVVLFEQGVLYIGLILLFEPLLYGVLLVILRWRIYGPLTHWTFSLATARELIHHGWPFILSALFVTIYSRIDQVMLKHVIDASAVGLYDAAVRVAEVWLFIPSVIVASLFPAIVNAKKTSVSQYRTRLLLLTACIAALSVIVVSILSSIAQPLIYLLYGAAFSASVTVFIIYTWAGVFAALGVVAHTLLITEHRRALVFLSTAGTALLNTILNLWLIPEYGIAGAAWSTLISYAVLATPLVLIYRLK